MGLPRPCGVDLVAMKERVEASGFSFPPNAAVHEGEFGDSAALAIELLDLIVHGQKRATCSLPWLYEVEAIAVPQPGDFEIIAYPDDRRLVVIRYTKVETFRFCDVPEDFALAEDEGTYEAWRAGHVRYFTREAAAHGRSFSEEDRVLCQRFELVHIVN